MLFEHVRALGEQRRCGRMDWQVLDRNTPARDFLRPPPRAVDEGVATVSADLLTYFPSESPVTLCQRRDAVTCIA
jgi:hypothetical protein